MAHPKKKLIVTLCFFLVLITIDTGQCLALPECIDSPTDDIEVVNEWVRCRGTYNYANGDKYVGEFSNGARHGRGSYTYTGGRVKKGTWKFGDFQGAESDPENRGQSAGPYLTSRLRDESRISSPSVPNHKQTNSRTCPRSPLVITDYNEVQSWNNCEGTIAFGKKNKEKAGEKYAGEWKGGTRHGYGTYVGNGGQKYVGEWRDNKFHGRGTWSSPTGHEYIGEWKNGLADGQGTLTHPDGRLEEGMWENWKLIKAKEPDNPQLKRDSTQIKESKQNLTKKKAEEGKPVTIQKSESEVGKPTKDRIIKIQTALKDTGHYSGTVDGIMGPVTINAIKIWQESNNFNATGHLLGNQEGKLLRKDN